MLCKNGLYIFQAGKGEVTEITSKREDGEKEEGKEKKKDERTKIRGEEEVEKGGEKQFKKTQMYISKIQGLDICSFSHPSKVES